MYLLQNLESVLKSDNIVSSIIERKISCGAMILKADRQAVANVLVEALIENLGTWYGKIVFVPKLFVTMNLLITAQVN